MMNDWVLAAIAFALSLAAFHYASKLITRVTGRARGGMANLHSAIAFLALMVAGAALVSSLVSSSTPLVYVAYGVVGGVASLVSQSSSVHRTATFPNHQRVLRTIHRERDYDDALTERLGAVVLPMEETRLQPLSGGAAIPLREGSRPAVVRRLREPVLKAKAARASW